MKSKKIVYISTARMPTEKAYGYQISKVCSELAKLGADVSLWAPKVKNHIKESVYQYYGVPNNFAIKFFPTIPYAGGKTLFLLRRFLIFCILFFLAPSKSSIIYTRSPEIVWLFGVKGYKVAYSAHNWPETKEKIFAFFLKSAAKIICNSSGTEKKFNSKGFANTVMIPNGVDISEFNLQSTKETLREELDLPLEAQIVLYTGHLYKWKGARVIIETAKLVGNEAGILFVCVGGTKEDIAQCELIKRQGDIKNILFLGHKRRSEIPRYLKAADVLVLPNVAETKESMNYTSPIKMFEYMASGIPIVATKLASIQEVLNDSNALLVREGDAQALKEGIEQILGNKDVFQERAREALKDVEKFTWSGHAQALLSALS